MVLPEGQSEDGQSHEHSNGSGSGRKVNCHFHAGVE